MLESSRSLSFRSDSEGVKGRSCKVNFGAFACWYFPVTAAGSIGLALALQCQVVDT